MICPNCHSFTTSSNGFCQYCGAALPTETIRVYGQPTGGQQMSYHSLNNYYGMVSFIEYQEMKSYLTRLMNEEQKKSFRWGALLGSLLSFCITLLVFLCTFVIINV